MRSDWLVYCIPGTFILKRVYFSPRIPQRMLCFSAHQYLLFVLFCFLVSLGTFRVGPSFERERRRRPIVQEREGMDFLASIFRLFSLKFQDICVSYLLHKSLLDQWDMIEKHSKFLSPSLCYYLPLFKISFVIHQPIL